MEMKRIMAAGMVFCMGIQLFCACGKEQPDIEDKVYLGVAYYDQSDTFLNSLIACLKDEIQDYEEKGYETAMLIRGAGAEPDAADDQPASERSGTGAG